MKPSTRLALCLLPVVCLLFGVSRLPAQQTAPTKARVVRADSFREVTAKGKTPDALHAEVVDDALTASQDAEPLQVEVNLRMRHFQELERRVAAGEILSREEMAARFLPTEKDYKAVVSWLKAQGLTVEDTGSSRVVLLVTGTPAQFKEAFQTKFARVKFRGEQFTSAVAAPSLPAELEPQIVSVHGLQPYLHPRKHINRRKEVIADTGTPPYVTDEISTVYGIKPTGLTGAGQTIGIVIDALPLDTDLTKFWTNCGVPQSLSNISSINVRNRTLATPDGEETLDVSWSSGLASEAQIVIYACSLNFVNSAYSRILSDLQAGAQPNLHQVSMSYGAGEQSDETSSDINAAHQLYVSITAYGVSFFASSGDDGAYGNGKEPVQAVYPASDPSVTGVGGTTLSLNADLTVSAETAWSPDGSGDDSSSGGGISKFFAQPAYQSGPQVPTASGRQVPDVSLFGNPSTGAYLIFHNRAEQDGGTSLSTPCWAAICALINQARANNGLPALSGMNPALYPLQGTAALRDITYGNNGAYNAGAGYDLVTGLGVPNVTALVQALATAPATPAPVISGETSREVLTGSDFAFGITASNSPTSYSASPLPPGVNFDPHSGLLAGQPTTQGTYAIGLSATNAGGTGTGTFTLIVSDTPPPTPGLVLKAFVPTASFQGQQNGEFAVYLTQTTTVDLVVGYRLSGTAVNGVDYDELTGSLTIPAGATYGLVDIAPRPELRGEGKRRVTLTLSNGSGYTVQPPRKATVSMTYR